MVLSLARSAVYLCIIFWPVVLLASVEDDARRVLASRCWTCHSQSAMGGLRLDSREAILKGGNGGAVIVAGKSAESRLMDAVRRNKQGVKAMPPGGVLEPREIEALEAWINAGAPWTATETHWSFQSIAKPSGESLDALIAKAQASKGLKANTQADKRTLIRRVYFDLNGLPPTPEDFKAAMEDSSADWFSKVVEKLLASPHFGEQWGRHWLDVARYGEDDFSGTAVIPYANAWRFRDWVVSAINRDMPYDKFLKAQLAGDLMGDKDLLPATGLIGAGPWYYGIAQPPQSRADERNDRVDMVSRGMLGVTLACARCHDHKYDPFTQKDYYAMAGVFASTAYKEYPLVSDAEVEKWKKQKAGVDEAEKALNKFVDEQASKLAQQYAKRMADYMMATVDAGAATGLEAKVVARWKAYLEKPEENHPFLNDWFKNGRTRERAQAFQKLIEEITLEKRALDEENKKLVEAAKAVAPKPKQTIVLPGGYRSEEDFNPGAYIPSKSLERDRFVAYNRTFSEKSSPLKFDRELAVELMEPTAKAEYQKLKASHEALKKALPPQYDYLMGAGEFDPEDLKLNLRGNPEALGDVVERRFPMVLASGKTVRLNEGSGRLQLADAVAHHPLAARVAVNRVWLALFGQGLVRTPSNFGRVGDRPVMPDVLETLAAKFTANGYSMKKLIREIVLTEAYQRASTSNAANEKSDPDNRYCWRQSRRRLEAEPMGDAMLAVAGELDGTIGGKSDAFTAAFKRRTLYAKTSRFQQDETLSLFDLPSAAVTCEQRVVTNVPLQKLFFLNSDIVGARATALAKRIKARSKKKGVEKAYALLFHRMPTSKEQQLGVAFLKSAKKEEWKQYAQVLLSSNEFAYVD